MSDVPRLCKIFLKLNKSIPTTSDIDSQVKNLLFVSFITVEREDFKSQEHFHQGFNHTGAVIDS